MTDNRGIQAPVRSRSLDGVTILRYAHIYRQRASGGVERYLDQLNRGLLQRHRLTLLQMHLAEGEAAGEPEVESIGLGKVVWVPAGFRKTGSVLGGLPARMKFISRSVLARPPASVHEVVRRYTRHLRQRTPVLSDRLADLLASHAVDLIALHWVHYDVGHLLRRAQEGGVPYVLINHFDNARLALRETRRWTDRASGIGTVSGSGIPQDLSHRCTILSDGVDAGYFDPGKARSCRTAARPVIFLPARIAPGKGHEDLLKAVRLLVSQGRDMEVWFAGAVESGVLVRQLQSAATTMGLEGRVTFLGERNAADMRDLYAGSAVVALPSYAEGLPRILLEAQAMKRAVVAYDCGGIGEALLPGRTGFLVKTGDIAQLAGAIGYLLADEPARVQFGERARRFVSEEFGIARLIERHETFYLGALSAAGRL